jgi:microcystin-dependent protein
MAEPFLSEIRIFSFNFPPKGWAFCNGQLLPINQNQALFSLLGTTYGGDGRVNFALPNLRGSVPIHEGSGHTLGEKAGASSVTITQQTMPQHIHVAQGVTAAATTNTPGSTVQVATSGGANMWSPPSNLTPMAANAVPPVGGSQPHTNMMPYLVLNFCIALQGLFPSQN